MRFTWLAVLAAALLAGCGSDRPQRTLPPARAGIELRSPAFADGGTIPQRFTCDGRGVSPPLRWSGVPDGARELALLVEDPDAGRFVHWTVLGLAPSLRGLEEGRVPRGAVQTANSFGDRAWGPPCPPEGDAPHHYVFALYALRAPLGVGDDASADDVRSGIAPLVLARGVLTGRYGRR